MGGLRCVDGSVLSVQAVTCRDRAGQAYEITLRLARDSEPFAVVGQRCGYQLSELARQISAARDDPQQAAAWPDPDDRFPAAGSDESALAANSEATADREAAADREVRAAADPARRTESSAGQTEASAPNARASSGACSTPGEHEYFALRSRDRDDMPGTGELRCVLRSSAVWVGECMGTGPHAQPGVPRQRPSAGRLPDGSHGKWRLTRRAVIEAWGASGVGVRAVLTSAELMAFLDTVLTEPDGEVRADRVAAVQDPAGS
jgi:hypothetical protein